VTIDRRQIILRGLAAAAAAPALGGTIAMAASEAEKLAITKQSAEWAAQNLIARGYKADFSLESLREVERFFAEHSTKGKATAGGWLAERLEARIFTLGCYIGEVIRRRCGGTWFVGDASVMGPDFEVRFPNGGIIWPVQRAAKRFHNGPEDNVHFYGVVMVERCKEPARGAPK